MLAPTLISGCIETFIYEVKLKTSLKVSVCPLVFVLLTWFPGVSLESAHQAAMLTILVGHFITIKTECSICKILIAVSACTNFQNIWSSGPKHKIFITVQQWFSLVVFLLSLRNHANFPLQSSILQCINAWHGWTQKELEILELGRGCTVDSAHCDKDSHPFQLCM